jgi:hypothetical protein
MGLGKREFATGTKTGIRVIVVSKFCHAASSSQTSAPVSELAMLKKQGKEVLYRSFFDQSGWF